MAFGYGLLRGRMGASGLIRETGTGREISARGLAPGETAVLCALEGGAAKRCAQERTDEGGAVTLFAPGDGALFVAMGEQVCLWEAGERPEETYLACCAALAKLRRPAAPPAPPPPVPEVPKAAAPEAETVPAPQEALRAPSEAEPVDGLPALLWPRGTEEIRAYFDALPPFAPFYAPGWRFVRAPSPLPGTAYCAVGRYARDGRVTHLCYALPGTPQRPPAALPGYRYRQGYWIFEQAF